MSRKMVLRVLVGLRWRGCPLDVFLCVCARWRSASSYAPAPASPPASALAVVPSPPAGAPAVESAPSSLVGLEPAAAARRHRRQRRPGQPLDAGEGDLRDGVDQRHRDQGRRRHDDPRQRDLPDHRLRPAGQGAVPGAADHDALRQGPGRLEQPRGRRHRRAAARPPAARTTTWSSAATSRSSRTSAAPATPTGAGACLTRSSSATRSRCSTGRRTCRTPTGGSAPTARRTWASTSCCWPARSARTRR